MYHEIRRTYTSQKMIDIDLLDEEETKLLDSFNNVSFPYIEEGKTILDDFEEVVKKHPNEVAVVFKDKKYTYKEVDEISTRIANELIRLGAKKESVVSILINKSNSGMYLFTAISPHIFVFFSKLVSKAYRSFIISYISSKLIFLP